MKTSPGGIAIFVSWPAADMDNPAHAEHGFSKGDLNSLSVWATLGMAQVWSQMTPQALAALTERDKLRLIRYQDFRGNLAGLYYGTPRARRWGEFLYMLMWLDKYKDMPNRNSRKACAAMFLAEFLANPAKYPSLTLPDALPPTAPRRSWPSTSARGSRNTAGPWPKTKRSATRSRHSPRTTTRPSTRPKPSRSPTSSSSRSIPRPTRPCAQNATPG